MQFNKCEDCINVYYSYFCGYNARWCKIHNCIDCNPDSYLNTLKGRECPDFIDKKESYSKITQKEIQEDCSHITLPSYNKNLFLF